ncbi:MAG: DUF4340 domain-containing protein [Oscillospiraceae bacterium]|nr:DUF4340 domain-containing protein [Oscillospiraceae bacterium]
MSKVKIVIFSMLALLVLGGILLVLLITAPTDIETPPEVINHSSTIPLMGRDLDEIETVEITNQMSSYTIQKNRTKTDEYYIESFGDSVKTNQAEFSKNLGYLALLPANELVEENADLDKYGLKTPLASINVYFDDDSYTLKIGLQTGNLSYISINDEKSVYVIDGFKVAPLLSDELSYVERNVFQHSGEAFSRLEVVGTYDEPIVITPGDRGGYLMSEPVRAMLHPDNSVDYINSLFNLTADSVAFVSNSAGKTLDKETADYIVSARLEDESELVLFIGEKTDEGYYATSNTAPGVMFIVNEHNLPWVTSTIEDIIMGVALMPYIFDLSEFSVEADERVISITVVGDELNEEFLYNDEVVLPPERAKELYRFMISAQAESVYTKATQGARLARFTYRYEDTTQPDDIVEFFRADDRGLIISINGKPSFRCRETYLDGLIQSMNDFLTSS